MRKRTLTKKHTENLEYDIVIIGAGISGLVLAERYANVLNKKVLIIEKRNHIGGNCYDFINKNNILVPKYGPHFFHTNEKKVWKYVNKFSKFRNYEHRVLSNVDDKLVPVPVNINTMNKLFNLNIKNEKEMKSWLTKNTEKIKDPKNSEEAALARVGKNLYEKLFKEYTKKQWDLWPKELDAEIMNRIPIRTNFEDRYFTDIYQAVPQKGYTKLFNKMVNNKNIKILLNTEWNEVKNSIKTYEKLFFTGQIDRFFGDNKKNRLQYRSLTFKHKTINIKQYQPVAQVNYPALKTPYTRITEPKHSTGQKSKKTTIIYEYPTWEGDPYYPVLNKKNLNLYSKYQKMAGKLENDNIYFVGRLANYKYFNMDQAFLNVLNLFNKIEK